MNPMQQRQPQLADHPPMLCAHCGATQKQSLILAAPPTPTVCIACGGAVILGGPIWMIRLSELATEAVAVSAIRMALTQAQRQQAQANRRLDA